jgi:hypothetical protein
MIIEINTTDDANQIAAPCRICSRVGLNSILPLGTGEAQPASIATNDARFIGSNHRINSDRYSDS